MDISNKDPYAKQIKQMTSEATAMVQPLVYDQSQVMAYVAHRVPGIYSCNYRTLHEV